MAPSTAPRAGPCLRGAARALLLLAVAGCAGGSNVADDLSLLGTSSSGLSPSAAALLERAKRSARTRVTGAAGGAALGIGGALLASGGVRDRGERAAAVGGGAAAGAALGYAAGAYVDARNRQAAGRQEELRGLVAAAEQDAERYQQARLLAQSVVEESGQEIERLNRERAAGRDTAAAYRDQARTLNASIASTQRMARELEGVVTVMDRDIAAMRGKGQEPAELEERREALRSERASLQASYQALLGAVDALPPETRTLVAEARR